MVDMKDANFIETILDIDLGGPGYILKVERTYNSRSIYDGLFGFGWCSDFEVKVNITPDSKIKVTECGGGLEIIYADRNTDPQDLDGLIQKIVAKVKAEKRKSGLKGKYFDKLREELKINKFLRDALASELGFKGQIQKGKSYYAKGRGLERVIVEENTYKRILTDGTHQIFNSQGHLISMYDKSKNLIKLNYTNGKLINIIDNHSRRLDFIYNKSNGKIRRVITSPSKLMATYEYSNHDLILTKDSKGKIYRYKYDGLHNMTQLIFPDQTTKIMKYRKDKDWVTSLKDRDNCKEVYQYKDSQDDPRNHYWSEVVKKCKNQVTNRSKYEFWHKKKKDGQKYLARVKSVINNIITDVKYHPEFGRPVYKLAGNQALSYKYYSNGMLKSQKSIDSHTKYFYSKRCNKISKIVEDTFLKRKLASRISTKYKYYSPSCYLKKAYNSKGEMAHLLYDKSGRVYKVMDHTNKILKISYDKNTGRPNMLIRPGLGAITVKYNAQGKINSVQSRQGTAVATQVAQVFNNILRVIGPVANDINI